MLAAVWARVQAAVIEILTPAEQSSLVEVGCQVWGFHAWIYLVECFIDCKPTGRPTLGRIFSGQVLILAHHD